MLQTQQLLLLVQRTKPAYLLWAKLLSVALALGCPVISAANTELPLGLQSYEPNTFGYTKNNDEVSFENIQLSVKFPLMPDYFSSRLNFAFTGRFGFYISTRDSGPVVGKEYNPSLFWQQALPWDLPSVCKPHDGAYTPRVSYGDPSPRAKSSDESSCYFMIGYDHDSNGQIINSFAQYLQAAQSQSVGAANDAISRGWDYAELGGRFVPWWTKDAKVSIYPKFKFFLHNGLLQGHPEELHDWESPPDGKPRRAVDGLSVLAKYQAAFGGRRYLGDGKLAVKYTTGYQDPFKFSTVRFEAGVHIFDLPIVAWYQKGYMSDLAQYYRNVSGYGLEIEIGGF